jgi:hypothetical protein
MNPHDDGGLEAKMLQLMRCDDDDCSHLPGDAVREESDISKLDLFRRALFSCIAYALHVDVVSQGHLQPNSASLCQQPVHTWKQASQWPD